MSNDTAENRPKSKQINTLFTYDTELSADSVEWCPHIHNVFVCATYQLNEQDDDNTATLTPTCKRSGRILLFSIDAVRHLTLHQTIETAAVLDQKWCPTRIGTDDRSVLGVAKANGHLDLYELIPADGMELKLIATCIIGDDTERLVLSLDWSKSSSSIVCSDSKGFIHRLNVDAVAAQIDLEASWLGHGFEAWIAAFDYWDDNIVFSGGDDCLFLKFDKRVGTGAVATNRKSHEAGVTSIHSNAFREHIVATGSYDCNVRLWDTRQIKSPISSVVMPGTLWRLKWDPFSGKSLLAACMLGGVHVVDWKDEQSLLEVVESFYGHKNIAYGADWSHLKDTGSYEFEGNAIIASCSFYDHLLCVSKLQINNSAK